MIRERTARFGGFVVRQPLRCDDPFPSCLHRERNTTRAHYEQRTGSARPRERIAIHSFERERVWVGRIARRHDHKLRFLRIRARDFAQSLHRVGERELRTGKSAHEITAPDLTTKFQSLELVVDRAPRHWRTLAAPPVARHYAIPFQPLARYSDCAIIRVERAAEHAGLVDERPATGPCGYATRMSRTIGASPFWKTTKIRAALSHLTIRSIEETRRKPAIGIVRRIRHDGLPSQHLPHRFRGIVRDQAECRQLAQCFAQR